MEQRVQFISDWLSGDFTKVALCNAYEISRPTGDKWIARYESEGVDGLKDYSRAAHSHPNAIAPELCERIVAMKLAHQDWGPKKVLDRLNDIEPQVRWPADSTAAEILKRAGLVKARKPRKRVPAYSQPFGSCQAANQTWSGDFKGHFALGNGQRCYPLTITDNHSRFLLQCRALAHPSSAAVRPWFEWVFREYGLPQAIRTDNGEPFASVSLGGVSQLSKWWIQLGVRPERTRLATPSENGRHERMHRTLKAAATQPPATTMAGQQRKFDTFEHEYNHERSHEALGRQTPARHYQPSTRPYPARLREVEYGSEFIVRRVRHNGEIKWRGHLLYVSGVLAKEPIGLRQLDEHCWQLRYSFHLLGTLQGPDWRIMPTKQWHVDG